MNGDKQNNDQNDQHSNQVAHNGELERVLLATLDAYREDSRHEAELLRNMLNFMVKGLEPVGRGIEALMLAEAEKTKAQANKINAEAACVSLVREAELAQAQAEADRVHIQKLNAELVKRRQDQAANDGSAGRRPGQQVG